MKKFELIYYRFNNKGGFTVAAEHHQLQADDLVSLVAQFCVIIAKSARLISDEEKRDILDKKASEDIPFESPSTDGLVLSVEEALAFSSNPFSWGYGSEQNYPGYNKVVQKIHEFADEHRAKK